MLKVQENIAIDLSDYHIYVYSNKICIKITVDLYLSRIYLFRQWSILKYFWLCFLSTFNINYLSLYLHLFLRLFDLLFDNSDHFFLRLSDDNSRNDVSTLFLRIFLYFFILINYLYFISWLRTILFVQLVKTKVYYRRIYLYFTLNVVLFY